MILEKNRFLFFYLPPWGLFLLFFTGVSIKNAATVYAVFYALHHTGWLVKLEVFTFMNPRFVFLGLCWDLNDKSSKVQNDRVSSIVQHRVPRSIPELASRLATLQ